MDPFGLLVALAALTLFPGGLFLAAVVTAVSRAAGLKPAGRPSTAELAGCALAAVAMSLIPLPGSPLERLPSADGASGNLAASVMILAAAMALSLERGWDRLRATAAVLTVIPLFALAAATSSLSLGTVVAVPGSAITAARVLAAASLLLAAPMLTAVPREAGSRLAPTVLGAALPLLALSLVLPSALRAQPAWAVAAAAAAGTVLHAALAHQVTSRLHKWRPGAVALAALAAASATVLAVLSGT